MPNQNNSVARLVVPLVMALAGLGVVAAFFINSKPRTPGPASSAPATTEAPTHVPAEQPAAASDAGSTGSPQPAPGSSTVAPQTPPTAAAPPPASGAPAPGPGATPAAAPLRAVPSGELHTEWPGIGAPYKVDDTGALIPGLLDEASPFELRLEFSPYGAGIGSLLLAHHHTTWTAEQSQGLQVTREWTTQFVGSDGSISTAYRAASPMAAMRVWITENGVTRDAILWQGPARENVWRLAESGESFAIFEALIVEAAASEGAGPTGQASGAAADPAGAPLVRVRRKYEVRPDSYVVAITHSIENLTNRALEVQVQSFGPTDLVPATTGNQATGYGGDLRRLRFGSLASPQRDPGQQFVIADDRLRLRSSVASATALALDRRVAPPELWPTQDSIADGHTLVWAGMTNRYFGVAVHTLVDEANPTPPKALASIARIDPLFERLSLTKGDDMLAMRLTGVPLRVEPGGTASSSIGMFAGPLSRPVIDSDARAKAVGLSGLVVYNFGGMCGGCTFGWLTGPLIGLLRFLHNAITQDWALAIILLVVCVRGALHPVQQWSQIRTQRFAKQMQAMSPKLKKVQEKYKEDRAALQRETAKLWREEGITPASLVGCIPPFLQTPIWIALSAMIYFAVELRHEAAFYGVFQAIAPSWSFLADLSEPDAVVRFGGAYKIPLIGLSFSSLNVLPLILALVFYVHSKSISPPPTATMTPEQQQAQTISKWMMVVIFPVMMYAAPSGFTLYFIANSTIAIFQTAWIKAHITRHDLDNPEKAKSLAAARRKAVSSSDSFMARMARRVEEAQKARQGNQPGPGKAMQRRPDTGKEPPRRFKDR